MLSRGSNMLEALKYLYPEKDGIYIRIVSRFLANPEFLKLSYVWLKSKESLSILEYTCNPSIPHGFSNDWFHKVALDIKRGRYKMKLSRSLYVFTSGILRTRFLTMSDFRDKILKKAIQLVLEEIYEHKEKVFSRFSHGFRFNTSPHVVFRQIQNE